MDTSLSMDDRKIAQSVAEVGGVLRALGLLYHVTVLSVDAALHCVQAVFRPEQINPQGGGGTDMGVGIEAAFNLTPRPDVIIVLTDGYTPWPKEKPKGVQVVVGLLGNGSVPPWAKVVKIMDD
jgi:predicted metal-dependent peptidase